MCFPMQRSEEDQFLFNVPADTLVQEALTRIVIIHNLRRKLQRLNVEGTLAQQTPSKPIGDATSHQDNPVGMAAAPLYA